jgi:MFS family permease
LLLASLAAHYLANNGVWAHLERIGVDAEIEHTAIGASLAVGQAVGLLGSGLAIWLADRVKRTFAVGVGVGLTALSCLLLISTHDALHLGFCVALFIGSLSFTVPFYLGALAAQDETGRLVMAGQMAVMVGLFLGPTIAAWLVTNFSMSVMLLASLGGFAVALLCAQVGLKQAAGTSLSKSA